MTGTPTFADLPPDFDGAVRLFPLPNLVLFPHVVQPLHIFEPRYCEMLEDALAGDGLIAMATLLPGWEGDYEGRPPIASVVCVGKILAHDRLPDGKHNLFLRGVCRAALRSERPPSRSFRQAAVEVLEDHYPPEGAAGRAGIQEQFLGLARALLPEPAGEANLQQRAEFEALFSGQIKLGTMTDILAYSLDLPLGERLRLLADCKVDRRAAVILEHLRSLVRLPPFHLN
jgi:ATP-dependent Lon protease